MYGARRERPPKLLFWRRSLQVPYIFCKFCVCVFFFLIITQPVFIHTRWNLVIVLIRLWSLLFRSQFSNLINISIWPQSIHEFRKGQYRACIEKCEIAVLLQAFCSWQDCIAKTRVSLANIAWPLCMKAWSHSNQIVYFWNSNLNISRILFLFFSGKSEQIVPTTSSKSSEFFLGTVHPNSNHDREMADNSQQQPNTPSKNTTEELLQGILNNIKIKSDSRLRPKLGRK